ncbi:alpha/beta fold hydrolase [Erythrobacter sp. THAF29]|uniref:alpha/beta fold hydrolase n=1 Tax=Erythrobacter sp. THAF29 TaxID=2587851 RepID=UPI001268B45A|nr:alpha/beta hydrolase [Erythrobacter sp. THAF29]QFT76932.1 Haloalkane dehalogenase [Erythrobacter sp. THAF29]
MKRAGQAAFVLILGLALAGVTLMMWSESEPAGCAVGRDPAVTLANKRAGEGKPYRDWCHEFDGNRLHVVAAGEGDTVIFIHGFPTTWYSLSRQMEHLRANYRVVAIDGLGAGMSDAPADPAEYKLAAMAEHLDALISDLGGDRVHLVGHDWGAAFAGAYAQSRPDRVRTVTIMSAPPQNIAVRMLEISEKQREISQYVERLKSATPALALLSGARGRIASGPQNHFEAGRISAEEAQVLKEGSSDLRRINRHINWYRANLPSPDAISDEDFWPSRNATLDVPTLLVWGEDDTVFDPAFIELLDRSTQTLTILRLEGVGHAPQFEATDAVSEAIGTHIGKVP